MQETQNIKVHVSNFTSSSYSQSFDVSLSDVDLSCGGAITNVEINYNGQWMTSTEANVYRFTNYEFVGPIMMSARITRTLYSVDDIINATDIINYLPDPNTIASATFDFGTNFCVDFKNPNVWYSKSELQLSYLYHPECFRFSKNASITLCRDTYNADGVASVPTSDHWDFIQSIVQIMPIVGTTGCNSPKMVGVGADFNATLCNMTSKISSYGYWNGDAFDQSLFAWAADVGNGDTDCIKEPWLSFGWDQYQMDDASAKYRMGVICYKNIPSIPVTTFDEAAPSTSTYVWSTFATIATSDANKSNVVLSVVFAVSGAVIVVFLVLFVGKWYLKQKNVKIDNIVPGMQNDVEMQYTVEGPQNKDIKSDKSDSNNDDVQEKKGWVDENGDEFEVIGDDELVDSHVEGQVCVTTANK